MTSPSGDVGVLAEEAESLINSAGILFFSDSRRPSLTTFVAGSPVRGSWWGHPSGHRIYQTAEALESRGSLITVKLLDGKVTWVARKYWPHLIAVGSARAGWQLDGLPASSLELLRALDRRGEVRADQDAAIVAPGRPPVATTLRGLERRLLVWTESLHTDSGAHTIRAVSWRRARLRWGISARLPPDALARRTFERLAELSAGGILPVPRLPWQVGRVAGRPGVDGAPPLPDG